MPNVGKSTLFNALLKKQTALVANYPFATIEPNIGVVPVPDERLTKLAEIVKTQKIIPAVVEFYDIAGLVEGAHKGEGLGNKFLSHIREVSVIAHVVRFFEDRDIIDVGQKPLKNIQIIEEELQLADLQTLDKQKAELYTASVYKLVKERLDQGVSVRDQGLSDEELEAIRQLNLLTAKPVIYSFNCSLEQLEENDQLTIAKIQTIFNNLNIKNSNFILFNPLVEETLDILIKKAYETLDLISFLTAGEKEVRAWTIAKGTLAPQAAGTIHTDFEKNFIKAEIVSYADFVELNGWNGARAKGKSRMEGRDYVIQEGDMVDFKVSI